jgi:hypothetical protein
MKRRLYLKKSEGGSELSGSVCVSGERKLLHKFSIKRRPGMCVHLFLFVLTDVAARCIRFAHSDFAEGIRWVQKN